MITAVVGLMMIGAGLMVLLLALTIVLGILLGDDE
jgi:hypothetical protein